jgi:hypothetical protein
MARWRALAADHLIGVRRETHQLVARYATEPAARAELDTLAAAERDCCSFAEWDVRQDADDLILCVRAEPDGVAAIAALFGAG